jgi:hypothetical protein
MGLVCIPFARWRRMGRQRDIGCLRVRGDGELEYARI